jgi:4'-phosphopantetheinyl transferase
LHRNELEYFLPLPAESRRISFLLGRYAAKKALRVHLPDADFPAINILSGIFKNPVVCFPMDYPWQVSITHAGSMACALAFPTVHPMALDLEVIDADRTRVIATQCRESEWRDMEPCGLDRAAACTVLWTAKEAIAKALKTGMTCPFELLEVQSVVRLGERKYQGFYKTLGQYKFYSWIQNNFVLTITLPKKTEIEFASGRPDLAPPNDGAEKW